MAGEKSEVGISVVLPNYNGKHLLEKNLPSLSVALAEAGLPCEVIVSDDCSTDDSVEYLKRNFPTIIIVSTVSNSGFSSACNSGICMAQYAYTCIVNTDVSFESDYFKNSMPYFENRNVFAVKGEIVNYWGKVDNILNIDRDHAVYFKRGLIKFKAAELRKAASCDQVLTLLGCCFICRTDLIKQVGGFDELFSPYYWEDLDLALTVTEKGYDLIFAPDCRVYHQLSSTISNTQSDTKVRLISNRNKFMLTWKHIKSPARWSIHVFFVLTSLCVRWLVLDWRYYVALLYALIRYRKKAGGGSFCAE